MDILIEYTYLDPAYAPDQVDYDGSHFLPESCMQDAFNWCLENLPLDHTVRVRIVDYSK